MPDAPVLTSLETALRGGASVLLLLVAALLLRDYRRWPAARLGALFALGGLAYALCSTPAFHAAAGVLSYPAVAIATGNNLVFWLFARALFDDTFRLRPAYAALWAVIVALGFLDATSQDFGPAAVARILGPARGLQAVGFALLATLQTIASWPADLVEGRRRLRVFVVAAAAAHTLLTVWAALAAHGTPSLPIRTLDVAALTAIAAVVAWSLLRVSADTVLTSAAAPGAPPPERARILDEDDRRRLAELDRLMAHERVYRQERLSIGRFAQQLRIPEHRLRRLINGGLGHRNFNAFLNGYRLADAKAALADPAEAEVPVLTIALDAGFNSLGPFNRAFKAETGLTPSEFRRAALARGASGEAPFSAGRISKSA